MRLIKRLLFALKYDFDQEFIVYSIPDQMAMSFTNFNDAKKFRKSQPMYNPKIMVAVWKFES